MTLWGYANEYMKDHIFELRRKIWRHDWSSQLLSRLSCVYNCDDQSCLHIFLRSSDIWSFIYSFAFFNIYGCITNSQCDHLPVGLIAQLVEHCTGIAEVMGSKPVQALISQLLLKVVCILAMINHVFTLWGYNIKHKTMKSRKTQILVARGEDSSANPVPSAHRSSNISNTRDSVSSGYPNTEKRVENTTRSGVFLTKFEVFG